MVSNKYQQKHLSDPEHHVFYPGEDNWPRLGAVASQLGVSYHTAMRWIQAGKLRGKKCHTPAVHWIVDPVSVQEIAAIRPIGPGAKKRAVATAMAALP